MAVSNNCSQVQIVRTTKNPSPGRPEMGSVLEKLLKVGKLSSDRAHSVRECATTRGEAGCDAAATFAAEYGGAPPLPSRTPPPLRASRSRRRCYNSRKPRRSDCPLELQRAAGKLARDGGRAADSDSIRSPTAHRRRRAAERARRNVPRPHGRAAHHRSAGHRPGGNRDGDVLRVGQESHFHGCAGGPRLRGYGPHPALCGSDPQEPQEARSRVAAGDVNFGGGDLTPAPVQTRGASLTDRSRRCLRSMSFRKSTLTRSPMRSTRPGASSPSASISRTRARVTSCSS